MFLFQRIRNFDLYTKPVDDCRVKTLFGGLITFVSFIAIGLLFFSEIISYFSIDVTEQLFVDSTSSEIKVPIHFDITFHKLACDFISVDVMGMSGENQDAVTDDVFKQRLNKAGEPINNGTIVEKQALNTVNAVNETGVEIKKTDKCGSCYGAIKGCCYSCQDVIQAYKVRGWQIDDISKIEQCNDDEFLQKLHKTKDQGCRVYGHVIVGKVGGNLHFAPGEPRSDQHSHYHDFKKVTPLNFITSHTFNHFSFGKPFPGKIYPLEGKEFLNSKV